jgi:hypothetical protein
MLGFKIYLTYSNKVGHCWFVCSCYQIIHKEVYYTRQQVPVYYIDLASLVALDCDRVTGEQPVDGLLDNKDCEYCGVEEFGVNESNHKDCSLPLFPLSLFLLLITWSTTAFLYVVMIMERSQKEQICSQHYLICYLLIK